LSGSSEKTPSESKACRTSESIALLPDFERAMFALPVPLCCEVTPDAIDLMTSNPFQMMKGANVSVSIARLATMRAAFPSKRNRVAIW
jgi:hypothetical protein